MKTSWHSFLKVEIVDFPLWVLIGTWAMREALALTYNDFRLQWIETAPTFGPKIDKHPDPARDIQA